MKFDRLALSDCFDSTSLANEIRDQFKLGNERAPLGEIASQVGIWNVREEKLNSIEGALVVPDGKLEGEIILNIDQFPLRKRFTFAHELGHFLHPQHHPDTEGSFNCSDEDIFKTFARDKIPEIENQANEFASELLIPSASLSQLLNYGCDLNFGQIIDCCEHLEVSKAFAIRKLQPLCETQIAFIFSRDGIIRYVHADKFPYLKVWSKHSLPERSSALLTGSDNTLTKQLEIDSSVWLKRKTNKNLYEQTYIQEDGYKITMLILK